MKSSLKEVESLIKQSTITEDQINQKNKLFKAAKTEYLYQSPKKSVSNQKQNFSLSDIEMESPLPIMNSNRIILKEEGRSKNLINKVINFNQQKIDE